MAYDVQPGAVEELSLCTPGPFILGKWYVAAIDSEVPARKPLDLTICGEPVTLWREDGTIRGATPDRAGKPLRIRCSEDLIWIHVGDGPEQGDGPALEVPVFGGPRGKVRLMEKVVIPAHQDDAVYGLLDPAHTPFVHRSPVWRGNGKLKPKQKTFEPSPYGFTMMPHAPVNSDIYKVIGGAISVKIEFRIPGLRAEYISNSQHTVLGLTALTPIDEHNTALRQIFFWDSPVLNMIRPFARMFSKPFLQQDVDIMALRRTNERWTNGRGLLVGDSDRQFLWYLKLKREWASCGHCPDSFANPLQTETLRWRT